MQVAWWRSGCLFMKATRIPSKLFPNATVWSNYFQGDGYDLVLIGRQDSSPINVDALDRRLGQPAYARVAASLADANFHSGLELLGTYVGRASDLAPMLAGAQLNDDLNLRLQYMAGLGLNSRRSAEIYRHILSYRRFPDDLFTGDTNALRELLGQPQRTF
jgi:spermidine synthase